MFAKPYIADRKPAVSPVVVSRSFFVRICEIMALVSIGKREEAMDLFAQMSVEPEMAATLNDLDIELF